MCIRTLIVVQPLGSVRGATRLGLGELDPDQAMEHEWEHYLEGDDDAVGIFDPDPDSHGFDEEVEAIHTDPPVKPLIHDGQKVIVVDQSEDFDLQVPSSFILSCLSLIGRPSMVLGGRRQSWFEQASS